jgi:DNA polymerase III epsilon subunit-like protein
MDFVSIDIETTGLNHETCQILEFGACVVKNWEIVGTFRRTLWHETISGDPIALAMNIDLIKEISISKREISLADSSIIKAEALPDVFINWLFFNKFVPADNVLTPIKMNVAGKNYSQFDAKFLSKLFMWDNYLKINRRVLDPAILYFDASLDAEHLPSLEDCKRRSGIFTEAEIKVKHRADKDAEDVALLLIHKLKPIGK